MEPSTSAAPSPSSSKTSEPSLRLAPIRPSSPQSTPNASSSSSPSTLPTTDAGIQRLARVLLASASLRKNPLLGRGERNAMNHRESVLRPRFAWDPRSQQKFVNVMHALVTVCTAYSGPGKVTVMATLSPSKIILHMCQDAGPPSHEINIHLAAIWRLVQQLRKNVAVSMPTADASTTLPKAQLDIAVKMLDVVYSFVQQKAVARVIKRLEPLSNLYSELLADPSSTEFQKKFVLYFSVVTKAAAAVAEMGLDTDSTEDWPMFLDATAGLYNMTVGGEYTPDVAEQLQVRAKKLGFDFEKSLKKALKIESAVRTLVGLALSPHRGWIADLELQVDSISLPPAKPIRLHLSEFNTWKPSNVTLADFQNDLRTMAASSTDKELTISPRIHPECELVARVVGDAEPLANEDLIPYVFSSKLHCYPCYLWLQGFNERRPSSSKVAFDGCHGSLTPGWLPPTSKDESILARMRSQIESELSEYTFRKQLWSMSFDMSNAMATAPTNEDREDVAAHLDEKELLLCN